jgi:uncharacterized damage-inducible protein DinB
MHKIILRTLLFSLLAPAAVCLAQENPLTTNNRFVYGVTQKVLLRSAEIMPEENYSFKPTEAVRSFGEIVGHVADAQYNFCSAAIGEKRSAPKVEGVKTTKADLIAALKEAFAFCNAAYDSITDASATQTVKLMGSDMPRLGVLTVNQMHTMEHYGNLVTYMRMKNLVPPTSDAAFMQQMRK